MWLLKKQADSWDLRRAMMKQWIGTYTGVIQGVLLLSSYKKCSLIRELIIFLGCINLQEKITFAEI